MKIYAIRDDKAEAFNNPFFMLNDAMCIRAIEEVMYDETHNFVRNSKDYQLFALGDYDTQTGKMALYESPKHFQSLFLILEGLKKKMEMQIAPKVELTEVANNG